MSIAIENKITSEEQERARSYWIHRPPKIFDNVAALY